MSSILDAAMKVFAKSEVNAPVREIVERAGVGLPSGTILRYRQIANVHVEAHMSWDRRPRSLPIADFGRLIVRFRDCEELS